MNKRSRERKEAEWRRAYGSAARVYLIRNTPSVASGKIPCVNAHVRSGGMSRKADHCWIVPLTYEEHQELHQHGVEAFERKYGVDLQAEARRIHELITTRLGETNGDMDW